LFCSECLFAQELDEDDPNSKLNLDSLGYAYINGFENFIQYDSIFVINNDLIRLEITFFFDKGSHFVLPKNYIYFNYKSEELVIYESKIILKVFRNDSLKLVEIIDKNKINSHITDSYDESIKKYTNLMNPYRFEFKNSILSFTASYTIPVTDIGLGVTIIIHLEDPMYCEYRIY
jgi:hypothetical protein